MLQIKQKRQKAGLNEQDSSFGIKMKTKNSCSVEARSQTNVKVEARSGYVGRIQKCCLPLEGENSCGQNST